MINYDYLARECDEMIQYISKHGNPNDIDFDIRLWETLKTALPTFMQTLGDAGMLSNMMVANIIADIVTKAINHRCIGVPIRSIEDAPADWFDPNDGPFQEQIANLESYYQNDELKNEYGYFVSNRRCSSIYYDPYDKTYHDLEEADAYYNDLTGIGWYGRMYDPDFIEQLLPDLYNRLNMGRFHLDTTIHSFPHFPKAVHNSLPCTWEEEALWDFVDIVDNIMHKEDLKESGPTKITQIDLKFFHGYLFFMRFNGEFEKDTYLLYVAPFLDNDPDEPDGLRGQCVVHLMPYSLPYDITESGIQTVYESHMNFMKKYMNPQKHLRSFFIFPSQQCQLEREDNVNPIFTFFTPTNEVSFKEFPLMRQIHQYEGIMNFSIVDASTEASADWTYTCDTHIIDSADDIAKLNILPPVKKAVQTVWNMIKRHDEMCKQRSIEIAARNAQPDFDGDVMIEEKPSTVIDGLHIGEKEDPTIMIADKMAMYAEGRENGDAPVSLKEGAPNPYAE